MTRLIREHVGQVRTAVEAMGEGIRSLLAGAPADDLRELAGVTHSHEGRADDIRREVERELVQGALFAGTRRTLLRLVDMTDKVANAAEAVMDYLVLQGVRVPRLIHPLVEEIIQVTLEQVANLERCIGALLAGEEEAERLAEAVEHAEGRVDDLERRSAKRLFGSEMPLAEKLLVRDFLAKLVEVSDRAEDVSDLVLVTLAVRGDLRR